MPLRLRAPIWLRSFTTTTKSATGCIVVSHSLTGKLCLRAGFVRLPSNPPLHAKPQHLKKLDTYRMRATDSMKTYSIPNDRPAELGVIGAALQGKYNDLCSVGINEDHFHDLKARLMWREITRMDSEGILIGGETLCHRFRGNDTTKLPGLLDVNDALDACPSAYNWSYWAEVVEEKRKARLVQEVGLKLAEECGNSDNLDDLVASAESVVFELNRKVISDNTSDNRKESFRRLIEMLEDAHKGKETGIPMGFPSLDRILGGMRPGQLIVLAARPAVGKSAIAGNIAMHLATNDVPVAFFSYEMTQDELNLRMWASKSDCDLMGDILNHGKDHEGRLQTIGKASAAAPSLSKAPLHIIDNSSLTVAQIRSHARRLVKEHGVKLIIIDYLQLIKAGTEDRKKDRHLQVAAISGGLKQMAMELQIPVLALAQLSREAERTADKRPTMSMLRESGSIEQDADVILFLYCEDPSMFDGPNSLLKVAVGKNRAGRQGSADLVLVRNKTRFEEASLPQHEMWLNEKRKQQVAC